MAATIDFPTQFTDTDPTFLLGANATSPAKAAISPAARTMIARPDPFDLDGSTLTKYRGIVNPQTGTTYTLAQEDTGTIITFDNAAPIVVSLPVDLLVGFSVMIVQMGTGMVTCVPVGAATLVNRENFRSTALQYSAIALMILSNPGGVAAQYLLAGDAA